MSPLCLRAIHKGRARHWGSIDQLSGAVCEAGHIQCVLLGRGQWPTRGMRGVLNDAVSIYFTDATFASAFVARWCSGQRIETTGSVFQVREDEPAPPKSK
jgi:hypothetical protein